MAAEKGAPSQPQPPPPPQPLPKETKKPRAEQLVKDGKGMSESERIHLENLDRINNMTLEEYEQAQEELFASMDVNVLQSLLKRAEAREEGGLDQGTVEGALGIRSPPGPLPGQKSENPLPSTEETTNQNKGPSIAEKKDEEKVKSRDDGEQVPSQIHFSKPGNKNIEVDPDDPEFLDRLKDKYFPDLESEPEKMAWMKPIDQDEEYDPEQSSLAPSELRFDFKGNLISPRQARSEAYVGAGLHHHGDAPSAAGYTVAELGHLARSQVPAQRNIAIQTLGRILYRLGKGLYGQEIGSGLWGVVDYCHILDTLHEASESRHMGVQAYAVEALWLWQQGGAFRPAV